MKPFDDFLKSLSEKDLTEIISKAAEASNSIAQKSPDLPTRIGNQTSIASYQISIGLLQKYHEWISQ